MNRGEFGDLGIGSIKGFVIGNRIRDDVDFYANVDMGFGLVERIEVCRNIDMNFL